MYDTTAVNKATILGGSLVAVAAILVLKYNNSSAFAEARRNIPTVRSHPLLGSIVHVFRNKHRFLEFLTEEFDTLDTMTIVMHVAMRPSRILTIDPQNIEYIMKDNFENYLSASEFIKPLLGDGIFTFDGEHWRHPRKMASHIFNVANLRDHFTEYILYEQCPKAETEIPVDLHDIMHRFTLDSFVLLGFGVKINASRNKQVSPFATSLDFCQTNCFERIQTPATQLWDTFDHYRVVKDFAYRVISERREQLAQGKDFTPFMTMRDLNGNEFTDRDLHDTVLSFIVAGRDTTAQTLSWTFYNLMLHPRIEAKLLAEIEKYWPKEPTDSPTLYGIVKSLTYAHAVMYESLRLHPPVAITGRCVIKDDVLPDGTHIKGGEVVNWSAFAMARSTKIWGTDAKEYRPERWIDDDVQNLAVLEVVVAIAILMQSYKLSLVPGQNITYSQSLTLPMKGGMQVYVSKRYP
ncbi:cytochrome P450 [Fennellomyces sp. T-0311]|nr:cytochrome P450 [Fennellomyces sp. T-0311]